VRKIQHNPASRVNAAHLAARADVDIGTTQGVWKERIAIKR
jgi:hypothetical protein